MHGAGTGFRGRSDWRDRSHGLLTPTECGGGSEVIGLLGMSDRFVISSPLAVGEAGTGLFSAA